MSQQLLDELNVGIDAMSLVLPACSAEKLIDFIGLINHWNRAFNLTAIRNPKEMISKHLLDSLSVLPFIGDGTVIDVGSGAGLPGIPLALAKPQTDFVLIDSKGKKTRFMNQAKIVLQLDNVEIIKSRVEDYHPITGETAITFDTVISRAYASTENILASTSHLHHKQTRILIMQGKLEEQFDGSEYGLHKTHALDVYRLNAQRHLVEIRQKHLS